MTTESVEAWRLRCMDVIVHRDEESGAVVAFHSPLDERMRCAYCIAKEEVRKMMRLHAVG